MPRNGEVVFIVDASRASLLNPLERSTRCFSKLASWLALLMPKRWILGTQKISCRRTSVCSASLNGMLCILEKLTILTIRKYHSNEKRLQKSHKGVLRFLPPFFNIFICCHDFIALDVVFDARRAYAATYLRPRIKQKRSLTRFKAIWLRLWRLMDYSAGGTSSGLSAGVSAAGCSSGLEPSTGFGSSAVVSTGAWGGSGSLPFLQR